MLNSSKIVIYASKLSFPRHPAYLFPLYMLLIYIRMLNKPKTHLKIKPAPVSWIKSMLKSSMRSNSSFDWNDIHNTIIVRNAKYKQGAFVIVYSDTTKRVAFVIHSSTVPPDCLVATNLFTHNLKAKNVQLTPTHVDFLDEISLALIGPDFKHVDELIKNHFKTPKIVCENDVVCIDVFECAPKCYFTSGNGLKNVHFKCQIEGRKWGVCVIGETTFKQSPNVQDFLPPAVFSNWVFIDDYFDMLHGWILPFTVKQNITGKLQPVFLIEGAKGLGKRRLISSVASKLGLHEYQVSSYDFAGSAHAQTEAKIGQIFNKAKLRSPCMLVINNFQNFALNNEGQSDPRIIAFFKSRLSDLFDVSFPLVLICVSHIKAAVPPDLKTCFLNVCTIETPNVTQRKLLLDQIATTTKTEINTQRLAEKTSGFVLDDLRALVYWGKTSDWNFDAVLESMRARKNSNLEAAKVPNVTWNDIGGLSHVRNEIFRTINLPLKFGKLLSGLIRSGILLHGPPGTGKTLVAKAIANDCNLCFISVKGPELLNIYVGQSEKNVRQVFQRARDAAPCVIFFDELDALAPKRGASGDSGGVMDRVVSQLSAEMDGLNQTTDGIFIIGATNRPDLVDSALLRPGRFDNLLYLGPCMDAHAKIGVLVALTRKFHLDNLDLNEIVNLCPETVTGADLYGLCSDAWKSAAARLISDDKIRDLKVTIDDFRAALDELNRSSK